MNVQDAMWRDCQQGFSQDLAIGYGDHGLWLQLSYPSQCFRVAEGGWLKHIEPELFGGDFHGGWRKMAAPAGGPIRLRYDGADVMSRRC
jgi:hypothetical protein